MAREPSLPPEVEEDPQAAAVRLWKEVRVTKISLASCCAFLCMRYTQHVYCIVLYHTILYIILYYVAADMPATKFAREVHGGK